MPVNRNALIRYKTIDRCLQNRFRKWSLEDLIEACSEALYEYEGIDKGVSRRTVQGDIQTMRSDKLGYNAPIIVEDKRYYTYEDPGYSITNSPLSEQDLHMLTESVEFMKQFSAFKHFNQLGGMLQKLEDHIHAQRTHTRPVIDFEKNNNLTGLGFLDRFYKAIVNKKALLLQYQSFKAPVPSQFDFHPQLLKEYRNRWFVIGMREQQQELISLALDRVLDIEKSEEVYHRDESFDPVDFYHNAIGVSISPNMPVESVRLQFSPRQAPYVQTKPLHHSQEVIENNQQGLLVELQVVHNFELEKTILGFGEDVQVLQPDRLKNRIKDRLDHAFDRYQSELNSSRLTMLSQRLIHRGISYANNAYTKKQVRLIKQLIDQSTQANPRLLASENLLETMPRLKPLVLSRNLQRLLYKIDEKARISSCKYFISTPQSKSTLKWHQDFSGQTPSYLLRIALRESSLKKGALMAIPGTQKKQLAQNEIDLIVEISSPTIAELGEGGIVLYHAKILRKQAQAQGQKRVDFLELGIDV